MSLNDHGETPSGPFHGADSGHDGHRWPSWGEGQQYILELIARSASLAEILESLARLVEAHSRQTICSILLVDEDGETLRVGAVPSLPEEFRQAVDGLPIQEVGSCATAAYRRAAVITADIASDPLWMDYKDWMIDNFGLRSAWSTPIFSSEGEILGTVALYGREPGAPTADAEELVQRSTYLAGIAIQRARDIERLYRAKCEAEEASYAKSKFLANISHELRTPLNAIIGYSEILVEELEEMGHDGLADDLRNVRQAGQRLLAMIGSVLDMSKIQAQMMAVSPSTFSLSSVVDSLVAQAEPYINDKGNRLKVEVHAVADDMFSDSARLVQILENLLSNANKFTERGLIELRLWQERQANEDWVVFEVRDEGIGIAPERLDTLFSPFAKIDDPEHTRRTGGIGLGLSLSHQLCCMLGGEIGVESELGGGTTFTVRVPLLYPNGA